MDLFLDLSKIDQILMKKMGYMIDPFAIGTDMATLISIK